MKYVFLNPQSCSGLALKKWSKIKDQLPELSKAIIVENFYQINWNDFHISPGDSFISAGGDGTLHCMVNALVLNKGHSVLDLISIGHIGLGSNNSFLRPYSECKIINSIPMKIADEFCSQDLIEIEVKIDQESKKVLCIANSSIGFLASANILFNKSSDIALLKKWNSDLADVYTFLKALFKWKSIEVQYLLDGKNEVQSITNMHFMKKAYYASDLGFPEEIPSNNGLFRLNVLLAREKMNIFSKFFQMMILKKLEQGRDFTKEIDNLNIKSQKNIPLEIDGEIYYGSEFKIKVIKEGIKLCK